MSESEPNQGTLDSDLLKAAIQVAQVDRVVGTYKRKRNGERPFLAPDAARAAQEAALSRDEAAV